jgi:hypothetical protein
MTARKTSNAMWDLVVGATVQETSLPDGCSRVVEGRSSTFPYTCSRRMTHVAVMVVPGVERTPYRAAKAGHVEVFGYCRQHAAKAYSNGSPLVVMEVPA